MATLATDTLNQTSTVTNSTAEAIVLASVKDDLDSGLDAYAEQLTAVSAVIDPQGQGTITLNQPNQTDYNLIGMRAKDLFPVANRMAVMPVECDRQPSPKCTGGISQYYAHLTIDAAEAESMQQALKFYQSVAAFPGLEPGLSFIQLVSDCKEDYKNAESRINDFFQKTQNYAKCTLESFAAVQSYCFCYAFSWAHFQDHFSYEVAQVNPDADAREGLLDAGKIVLTKKTNAPYPTDVNDRNGGYEIAYHPAEGEAIPLALVDGILVSTENLTAPSVKLFFSYDLKRTFTGNEADNVVWPVLTGHIQQSQVIAVGIVEKSDSPAMIDVNHIFGDWKRFYNPKTAKDWVKTIGLTSGVIAAIGILAGSIYYATKFVKQGREFEYTTRRIERARRIEESWDEKFKELYEDILPESSSDLDHVSKDAKVVKDRQTVDAIAKIKQTYEKSVKYQRFQADMMREYGNPDSLQEVYDILDGLDETLGNLKEADWKAYNAKIPDIKQGLESAQKSISATFSKLKSEMNAIDRVFIEDDSAKFDEFIDSAETNTEYLEETEEGISPLEE